MITYSIASTWPIMQSILKGKNFDLEKVCFLHKVDRILVRASDVEVINFLKTKFVLIEAREEPDPNSSGWTIFGNILLFDKSTSL